MDLIDHVSQIASRMPKQTAPYRYRGGDKTAFVMPVHQRTPDTTFSIRSRWCLNLRPMSAQRRRKVDYAIRKDDKVIILVECKTIGSALSETHAGQLYRYFSVTEARFGVLTNGRKYRFYSDIDEPNKMDSRPFFEFDVLDFEEHQLAELKKFTKSAFSLDDILATASTLKYAGAVKRILERELRIRRRRSFASSPPKYTMVDHAERAGAVYRHRGRGKRLEPRTLLCNSGSTCDQLSYGACPDCIMIPETSCIAFNQLLSRAVMRGGEPRERMEIIADDELLDSSSS